MPRIERWRYTIDNVTSYDLPLSLPYSRKKPPKHNGLPSESAGGSRHRQWSSVSMSGGPLTPHAMNTREAATAVAPQGQDRLDRAAAPLTPRLVSLPPSHLLSTSLLFLTHTPPQARLLSAYANGREPDSCGRGLWLGHIVNFNCTNNSPLQTFTQDTSACEEVCWPRSRACWGRSPILLMFLHHS